MEQKTCIKCGCSDPEYDLRFVKVGVISSSSTARSGRKQVTTTTTTERIDGVDRCCVCDKCIRSKRTASAFGAAFGGLFGGLFVTFLLAIFLMSKSFNDHVKEAFLVSLLVGVVIAVIVFIVKMRTDAPLVAADIIKKDRKLPRVSLENIRFIPVERSIYINKKTNQPDLEVFKSKTGLKTNIAAILFLQFVATGIGNELVDQMLLQPNTAAAPTEQPTTEG